MSKFRVIQGFRLFIRKKNLCHSNFVVPSTTPITINEITLIAILVYLSYGRNQIFSTLLFSTIFREK